MKEKEIDKKQKIKVGVGIALIIIALTCIGGAFLYDNIVSTKKNKGDNSKDNPTSAEMKTPRSCIGTYYGESSGVGRNGSNYSYQFTYELLKDHTYKANLNGEEQKGTYEVLGEVLEFTYTMEHSDTDSEQIIDTFFISDDCSYFTYNNGIAVFNVNRQS